MPSVPASPSGLPPAPQYPQAQAAPIALPTAAPPPAIQQKPTEQSQQQTPFLSLFGFRPPQHLVDHALGTYGIPTDSRR